jgi:rubrerythrin
MDPVKISGDKVEVDWEIIKGMINKTETNEFKCKKCGSIFYNKNYYGKYPLCDKHMLKKVK